MPDETKPAETIPATSLPSEDEVAKAREILQKAQEARRKTIEDGLQATRKEVLALCEARGHLLTAEPTIQRLPDGRVIIGAEPVFTNKK